MATTFVATVIALGAATLLGSSSVAQRRALATVDNHDAGDPKLVAALARRGWWWAGTLASLAGLGLQVLALALGPLIAVQTTMTSSIGATTFAEWSLLGRRPTRRAWCGIALTAAGLLAVLLALAPRAGDPAAVAPTGASLVAAAVCAAVIAGAITLDHRAMRPRGRRARPSTGIGLAVATGLGYGFTAVQLKTVGVQLVSGWLAPLHHPAIYLAAVLGPLSILLSQNALQRGRRVIATVSLILVIDPLVGLAAGVAWFGERVTTAPVALACAGAAAAALVAGIGMTQSGAAPDDHPPHGEAFEEPRPLRVAAAARSDTHHGRGGPP